MEYVYLGRITNTHGLKGEIRIRSNFKYKDRVFKKGFVLYIGGSKVKEVINSYRSHKEYDMVTLCGIDNIDDVLKYKGCLVFVDRSSLDLVNEYVFEDYISCKCYFNDNEIGIVDTIIDSGNGNYLFVLDNGKYIPKNDNFILRLDLENKKLYLKNLEGLL